MKSIATHSSRVIGINSLADECAPRDARFWMLDAGLSPKISRIQNLVSRIIFIAVGVACLGCHTGTLKDPNDVSTAGPDTATVIMRQLEVASDSLNLRKDRREIDDRQYRLLITKIARDYVGQAKDKSITDDNAEIWGKVYSTARDWPNAEVALQRAVAVDRRAGKGDYKKLGDLVGDTLQLAAAQAHIGKVHEAVETARSIFNVTAKAKAPILTSVLFDIVPAGVRHGGGLELADLLRDAIKQHEQVIVDPNTDAGRDFLLARPHHIQRAWEEAAFLYQAAGKDDLAQQAMDEAQKINTTTAHL